MNKSPYRYAFCLFLLGGMACRATPQLPLPALASVSQEDPSGKTWRQAGTISGSVENAGREFRQALSSNGWRIEKMVAVGRAVRRSQLMICCRQRQRVILMVWEEGAGTCGFAWGQET